MAKRIKYVVAEASEDIRTVSIVRHEEDSESGEQLSVEPLLTLRATEGEFPSEIVIEDFPGVLARGFRDGQVEFAQFDEAYIVARASLDLPFQWAAPEGESRILSAVTAGEAPTT